MSDGRSTIPNYFSASKNGGQNALPSVSCRRTVLLRDKSDIDIAVVAVDGQRFFAALLALGQIALTLFDLAGNGKIIPTAEDASRDIPVLRRDVQAPANAELC